MIDIIAGARPNFMKVAPIIHVLMKRGIHYRLVHTGQHYDENMNQCFFNDLNIPTPDINLKCGSKTGAIMDKYDTLLSEEKKPDVCLVVGDVNSTIACTLSARKHWINVAHVEAGLRSFDQEMPEEINRIATDSISNTFFTTSQEAGDNLIKSGVKSEDIYFVGNTMADSLLANMYRFERPNLIWDAFELNEGKYCILTLHRPSNVDNHTTLFSILSEINNIGFKIVFPVHPRTLSMVKLLGVKFDNIHMISPLGYLSFNYLIQHSAGVLTDSGGIQAETTIMNIPCITIRRNLEMPETVSMGTNVLVMPGEGLEEHINKMISGQWKKGICPERWDGKTSERIVDVLEKLYVST